VQIRVGFEMEYECPAPTPMILALSIHYSRASDLVRPDYLMTQPSVPVTSYRDLFGNWCSRLVAPEGRFLLSTDALVNDSGQIAVDEMRLFRIYAEGNFIEASTDTPFLQTGEAKYGKPILDLAVTATATLDDATKCVLVSFDSTMISNLSVGHPIDLLCYARDSLAVTMRRRFDRDDPYFATLTRQWLTGWLAAQAALEAELEEKNALVVSLEAEYEAKLRSVGGAAEAAEGLAMSSIMAAGAELAPLILLFGITELLDYLQKQAEEAAAAAEAYNEKLSIMNDFYESKVPLNRSFFTASELQRRCVLLGSSSLRACLAGMWLAPLNGCPSCCPR
jgi:hypothetical protein